MAVENAAVTGAPAAIPIAPAAGVVDVTLGAEPASAPATAIAVTTAMAASAMSRVRRLMRAPPLCPLSQPGCRTEWPGPGAPSCSQAFVLSPRLLPRQWNELPT